MPVERLRDVPGFSIDRVAAAAEGGPDVLRLENLDTDLPPPAAAVEATRAAVGTDDANSYLPFLGRTELREAVAAHVSRLSGRSHDPDRECVITAGGTAGMFNVLLALLEPGDEVILSDPTYAGMINRVRLAGGRPVLVPFRIVEGIWRLDQDALRAAVGRRTRALFLMNPSIPSGSVLEDDEWERVARLCRERDLWLVYNAAMERILFAGRRYVHPASVPGLEDRTVTVGSVSKEFRMIGWRVGWICGPERLMADVARVCIYNVVTPVGIAQDGALAALTTDADGLVEAIAEWERRRDVVLDELSAWPVVPAVGGWSMLLDVGALGMTARAASERLLARGRVAATPMTHWGDAVSEGWLRLVFSNEPVERLRGLGDRVEEALGTPRT